MKTVTSVALVVGLLEQGGAQRVLTILANAWSDRGVHVTIVVTGDTSKLPFFELRQEVHVRVLRFRSGDENTIQRKLRNVQRILALGRELRAVQPDLAIGFIDVNNVMTLLATRGMGLPVIVSERTDPHGRPLKPAWELLRRLTYPWAQCLVAQSQHALAFFSPAVQARGRVIPNPVLLPEEQRGLRADLDSTKDRHLVVALGTLSEVKGFDRLIEAFGRVARRQPKWRLIIYGEGPCRASLEEQVARRALGGRVSLAGVTREPFARLREADLYVLSSRTEGFPNALAEAMACGLPVVSFDCHSGPRELIREGVDGVLVPEGDINALADTLDHLMGNLTERKHLAARAPDVLKRFSLEHVMNRWDQAVRESIAGSH